MCATKYDIKECIGKGAFSKVYKSDDTSITQNVAIKIINIEKKTYALNEIKIFESLNSFHDNIIKFIEWYEDPDNIYIVTELFTEGCELTKYIGQLNNINEMNDKMNIITDIIFQITCGSKYINDSNVMHLDLKPQNIYILKKSSGFLAKIFDFGLSKYFDKSKDRVDIITCGTPNYISPEVLDGYMHKFTDIYSLGIIFFYILSNGKNICVLYTNIYARSPSATKLFSHIKDKIKFELLIGQIENEIEHKTFVKLIFEMTRHNPDERLSHNEILKNIILNI